MESASLRRVRTGGFAKCCISVLGAAEVLLLLDRPEVRWMTEPEVSLDADRLATGICTKPQVPVPADCQPVMSGCRATLVLFQSYRDSFRCRPIGAGKYPTKQCYRPRRDYEATAATE